MLPFGHEKNFFYLFCKEFKIIIKHTCFHIDLFRYSKYNSLCHKKNKNKNEQRLNTLKKYAIEYLYPYIRIEVFKENNSMPKTPENIYFFLGEHPII